MAGEIWDKPETYPTTTAFDTAEGAPLDHASAPGALVSFNDAAIRESQRARGVLYASQDSELVEGGKANLWRRALYAEWKRFSELQFLAIGPHGWDIGYDVYYDDPALINFANVHTFAAAGSGHTWNVSWTPGSNDDLRSLSSAPNELKDADGESYDPPRYWHWAGQPGLVLLVNRAATFGMVQVYDIEFTGANTATITTDPRRVMPACDGYIWLIREHETPAFPFGQLFPTIAQTVSPVQCRHAVQVAHSSFASFKASNSSAYTCAGIHGAAGATWYCARMDGAGTDLSKFVGAEGRCNNTLCSNYSAITPWVPGALDFSNFLLASGKYVRVPFPGAATYDNALMIGRDLWAGICSLIGMKTGYYADGLYLAWCHYFGEGYLSYRTGEKTEEGYDQFQNWEGKQAALRAAGGVENDAFWPWGGAGGLGNEATGKVDPAGGASPTLRLLVQDTARTPAWIFEKAIGFRRVGIRGFDDGDGNTSYPSGYGESMVQRARPRKYTSQFFVHPHGAGTIYAEDNKIVFYATSQPLIGTSGFPYNLIWYIPRFGDSSISPEARKVKTVSGTIATATISGNLLTVDFELECVTYYIFGFQELLSRTFDCGGGVVCGDNARELHNPASGRGMGDRQAKIFPGDKVNFGTLPGLTCVSAVAYDEAVDETAEAPIGDVAPVGISQYAFVNYAHRDRAKFALEGMSGEMVRAALVELPGLPITNVSHSAISPPSFNYMGASTGYAPILKLVANRITVETLTPTADYIFDPNSGGFFVNTSSWPPGLYNLHMEGWVFDARKTHPCETAQHMRRIIDKVCEGYMDGDSLGALNTLQYFEGVIGLGNPHHIDITPSTAYYNTEKDWVSWSPGAFGSGTPKSWFRVLNTPENYDWVSGFFDQNIQELPYYCGISLGGGFDQMKLRYRNQLISPVTLRPLQRCSKAGLKTAVIDVSLETATLTRRVWDYYVGGGDFYSSTSEAFSAFNLRALAVRDLGGTVPYKRYEFLGDCGVGAVGALAPIEIDGVTYQRGTLDITDCVKKAYDIASFDDGVYLLLLFAPGIGDKPPSGEIGNAQDFIDLWSGVMNDAGDWPDEVHQITWELKYNAAQFSNYRVQFDPDELDNGPNLHFNSEGHAAMPNLLFSPAP